jgi:myo-inositol-1(or 4)-monophosphatase
VLLADRDLAIAAAEAGAAVVRSRYGATLTRFEKGRGDFATAADIEAEQAILNVVRSARPRDAVIGEESGRTGSARARRTWLVDPLCGTVNYAAQSIPHHASLAAAQKSSPYCRAAFRPGKTTTVYSTAPCQARAMGWHLSPG